MSTKTMINNKTLSRKLLTYVIKRLLKRRFCVKRVLDTYLWHQNEIEFHRSTNGGICRHIFINNCDIFQEN